MRTMENYQTIQELLEKELPHTPEAELTSEERQRITLLNTLLRFSETCRQLIWSGDFASLNRCFSLAERIYRQGNGTVKIALEHLFIPRLQLHLADANHYQARQLLPYRLQRTYLILYAKPL
jgi:hypothetical protein